MSQAEISKALFGGMIDVEALVSKMDPGPSDVHSFGESNRAGTPRLRQRRGPGLVAVRKMDDRTKRALAIGGIGATAIGGALGGAELGRSARELGAAGNALKRTAWLRPAKTGARLARIPRPGPAAKLVGVTGMLAGDAVATGEQLHAVRRTPVNKGFEDMVQGVIHSSRIASAMHAPDVVAASQHFGEKVMPGVRQGAQLKGMQHAGKVKATRPLVQSYGGPKGASERLDWLRENQAGRRAASAAAAPKVKQSPVDRGIAAGQAARGDIGRFAGTTSGKVALGSAGLLGVRAGLRHRANAAPVADPYVDYGKRADDVTFSGTFSKFDDDKRLAFGWANVSKINGLPVVDRQGDYVSIEDIEEAAYTYVERSRVGGDMHKRIGGKADGTGDRPHHVADLVESMVFDDAKCEALSLPDDFPRGWWVGFRVFDDEVWDMAKSGERTGFSIHGKGIRKSVAYDELMGVT